MRLALLLLCLAACRTTEKEEPAPIPSAIPIPIPSAIPIPIPTPTPTPTFDLVFAGDVLPHTHVLEAPVAPLFAQLPAFWAAADARIVNLEAPIGERDALEGGLALAAPPGWLAQVTEMIHPSAFVAANNHSCDLGPDGQRSTRKEAAAVHVPTVGLADDPWKPVRIAEKDGHAACLVAWTAFLNDAGDNLSNPKVKECVKGEPRVAYLPLGEYGTKSVSRILGKPGFWDGCDARFVYVHAGNEYKPQLELSIDQARAAAPFVDAVILSHPHVPDGIDVLDVKTDAGVRHVPVFRSLGNFVSNQGADWTPDKTGGIAFKNGEPDQSRTAWTRVAMLARISVRPSDHELRYGFALAFTERPGEGLALRPFPGGADDEVAARLRRGPKPFAALLDDPCRISGPDLPCAASQATQGTITKP